MNTGSKAPVTPGRYNVFLVEDSAAIRERLVGLLSPVAGVGLTGYAETADDAIAQILALRPHAVLLDLNLAAGSGLDVLRALSDAAPEIEVFVLTNFANDQSRQRCASLGARGFFDKSNEFEKVRDAIAARALPTQSAT
ncbi:MAG: response regulator transcription factor [Betaproteobacteria bacterium]